MIKDSNSDLFEICKTVMQMPAHLFWLDCNHVVRGCNMNQAKTLGYPHPDELIGQHITQLVPAAEAKMVMMNNTRVMQENRSLLIEEIVDGPQGERLVYLSNKSPLHDDEGQVIGVVGLAQDITHFKKQQTHLLSETFERIKSHREQPSDVGVYSVGDEVPLLQGKEDSAFNFLIKIRDHYESIISVMPGNIYWVDRAGRILGCNNDQARAFGFESHDQLIGKTYYELLPKEEADILLRINQDVMDSHQVVTTEETGTMAQGQIKTYFSTKTPLYDEDNKAIGILGISIDITDRKMMENKLIESRRLAEVANQSKTEFLMNMSHDLRTPFSGILGLSQFLHDGEVDVDKKNMLNDIVTSGQQLLTLLNEILDFTRVEVGSEMGDFSVKQDTVDLKALIEEVFGLFSAEIYRKQLITEVIYDDRVPAIFITDRVMLHRIILNLLSNAVKFTDHGMISVHVHPANAPYTVCLSVSDTGVGVPSVDLDKIFEKFSRATLAHEGFYQGTGLGLSLVQRMISCLQGNIIVSSELNQGTTFTCYLPLQPQSDTSADQQLQSIKSKAIDGCVSPILQQIQQAVPRVLVIEDHEISMRVAQHILENLNCEVSTAMTGKAALSYTFSDFDLILIDIGLPDMSGEQVACEIRAELVKEQEPANATLLVALSAHVDQRLYKQYIESGFDHVLCKPIRQ